MALDAATAIADEFWVAPTSQQDVGGLQVASNGFWPVTPVGAVRFAFSVPNNLLTFQSAKVVLIPHAPGGAATLNVFVCPAQNGGAVVGACAGPIAQPFTGVTNQLAEVDITAAVAPKVGTPGATYLAVVAYTTPTTTTDHVVGLRFRYAPIPPANVATLGANTFTGIQTAPGFVGDGSNVTGVNATLLDGLDSTAFALTAHGHDVSQITNAARLAGGNTLSGTQTINSGNIDLDLSTPTTGNVTKDGARFLHNFGGVNGTFLGVNAGNFTTTTFGDNTGIGASALSSLTTGGSNTAVGSRALTANTSGSQNAALGRFALASNTTGTDNAAFGDGALDSNINGSSNTGFGAHVLGANTAGFNNTAIGDAALGASVSGANNTAVGHIAGLNVTAGSNNVYLGSASLGDGDESDTMRLGRVGLQTRTFISGVRDVAVAGGEMVIIDITGQLGSGPVLPAANSVGTGEVVDNSLTSDDLGPNSVGTSELAADSVTAAKVAFNYAASVSEAGPAVNSDLLDGLDSTVFARLIANTFTATQTIDGGNLDLDASTAGGGNITKNGTRFLHNFGGAFNTFLGEDSGNFSMSGVNNTGVGRAVLFSNTTGSSNTAMGLSALFSNTTGPQNAAFGWSALSSNLGGGNNAAFGFRALTGNVNGGGNVAAGSDALRLNTIGSNNVAIGFMAGSNSTTGGNNIYLGANVFGVAAEANAIYIGNQGTQNKTTIAGIRGTVIAGGEMVVIDVNGRLGSTALALSNAVGSAQVIDNSLTSDDLGSNSVGDSEVAFNYAGSASKGGAASNLACAGCVDASEVSFAFAGLVANTFTGTQTIDTGNLDLEPSTSANGNILKNGVRFLHNVGTDSTFLGVSAGTLTNTGADNIGVGVGTLAAIDTGMRNVAIGNGAMAAVNVGADNVAIGDSALAALVNHLNNTAVGSGALAVLTGSTAGSNTAVGKGALGNMTSGGGNTVVGALAGDLLTNGTNNIYIDHAGAAAESLTIRVGDTQNRAFIQGIRGRTTGVADAISVLIDSNGQLGTVSSSRRFKEDIQDMADASDRLFRLHPVTFRYIEPYANGSKPIQFGLIAEEVADVFPELAVRNAEGQVETVHYETLNVLLLNEVQKQQLELEAQRERIAMLERRLNELIAQR
jgi:hypothetical protein